jgi:hypothetical protein
MVKTELLNALKQEAEKPVLHKVSTRIAACLTSTYTT